MNYERALIWIGGAVGAAGVVGWVLIACVASAREDRIMSRVFEREKQKEKTENDKW